MRRMRNRNIYGTGTGVRVCQLEILCQISVVSPIFFEVARNPCEDIVKEGLVKLPNAAQHIVGQHDAQRQKLVLSEDSLLLCQKSLGCTSARHKTVSRREASTSNLIGPGSFRDSRIRLKPKALKEVPREQLAPGLDPNPSVESALKAPSTSTFEPLMQL